MDPSTGLHQVCDAELLALARALARDELAAPITRGALLLSPFSARETQLEALLGLPKTAALALLRAVLAERKRVVAPAAQLVWSGPDGTGTGTRDPYEVAHELVAQAERSVLFCGAEPVRDQRLLRVLAAVTQQRALATRVVLAEAPLADAGEPAGRRALPLYARAARSAAALPYCLIADARRALLVSGAAPEPDADVHAVAIGVLLHEPRAIADLLAQWQSLFDSGVLRQLAP